MKVAAKQFDEAIRFLDQGLALEPGHPKLIFEKALALTHLRRFDEALTLYQSINTVGLHVTPSDVARGMRGQGGTLIEMRELDRAEALFKQSLEHEPKNKVAINELLYIAHLRVGEKTSAMEVTAVPVGSADKCVICGNAITQGHIVKQHGKTVLICAACQAAQTKKWWQFWR